MTTEQRVFTVKQAANMLQLSESTIHRKIKAGIIPIVDGFYKSLIPISYFEKLEEKTK